MRKAFFILSVLIIFSACTAYAKQEEKVSEVESGLGVDTRDFSLEKTPLNKLTRGVVNSLTCIAEVPASVCDISRKRNPIIGYTLGTVEGLVLSLARLGTGIFDTVTFIIPPYNKPLMTPEYAIDSALDKMN